MNNFKYDINQHFKDSNRDLTIISRELRNSISSTYKNKNNQKWYKCHCYTCGTNDAWIEENHLKTRGCPVCHGKQVSIGINDVNTTAPWISNLLTNKEDRYMYTKNSCSTVEFTCPNCNTIHKYSILRVYKNGHIPCECSDGISFPNKFVYKFLSNYNIQYQREKKFEWSDNKIYDLRESWSTTLYRWLWYRKKIYYTK